MVHHAPIYERGTSKVLNCGYGCGCDFVAILDIAKNYGQMQLIGRNCSRDTVLKTPKTFILRPQFKILVQCI